MSDNARSRILARLRAAAPGPVPPRPAWTPPTYLAEERRARFIAMIEAAHAEVHEVDQTTWPVRLRSILANKGVRRVMTAPTTAAGQQLAAVWADLADAPALIAYDQPVEVLKPVLVRDVDAAVTMTRGAIAETGTLVLWPSPAEPRLMSLLPPIHVALVEEWRIADSLAALMADESWAAAMPTNAVLISGPSKTADIEQTLAYGVHGPKELIVLLVRDQEAGAAAV